MSDSCSIGSSSDLSSTNLASLGAKGIGQLYWNTFAAFCSLRAGLSTSYELDLITLAARGPRQELLMVLVFNSCQV